jgi:hypothetical protein
MSQPGHICLPYYSEAMIVSRVRDYGANRQTYPKSKKDFSPLDSSLITNPALKDAGIDDLPSDNDCGSWDK